MENHEEIKLSYVSELLADVAATLMINGANTSRILNNTQRVSEALGFDVDIFISLTGLVVSVRDNETLESHSIVRSIPHVGVNFEIVSEVSILSWRTVKEKLTPMEVKNHLEYIKKTKHYSRWIVLFFVALAGACLARNLGGSRMEFIIGFIATFCGLFVRQELTKKKYNPFIIFAMAAFTAVSVVNIFSLSMGAHYNNALASCVLFLIPGVPLINSFIDLLEGYMAQGISRGVSGTILLFMIALGFFSSIFIFHHGYNFFS